MQVPYLPAPSTCPALGLEPRTAAVGGCSWCGGYVEMAQPWPVGGCVASGESEVGDWGLEHLDAEGSSIQDRKGCGNCALGINQQGDRWLPWGRAPGCSCPLAPRPPPPAAPAALARVGRPEAGSQHVTQGPSVCPAVPIRGAVGGRQGAAWRVVGGLLAVGAQASEASAGCQPPPHAHHLPEALLGDRLGGFKPSAPTSSRSLCLRMGGLTPLPGAKSSPSLWFPILPSPPRDAMVPTETPWQNCLGVARLARSAVWPGPPLCPVWWAPRWSRHPHPLCSPWLPTTLNPVCCGRPASAPPQPATESRGPCGCSEAIHAQHPCLPPPLAKCPPQRSCLLSARITGWPVPGTEEAPTLCYGLGKQ
nr:uncharacterized protein LOC127485185 [Oryctolagus cuniculus]